MDRWVNVISTTVLVLHCADSREREEVEIGRFSKRTKEKMPNKKFVLNLHRTSSESENEMKYRTSIDLHFGSSFIFGPMIPSFISCQVLFGECREGEEGTLLYHQR